MLIRRVAPELFVAATSQWSHLLNTMSETSNEETIHQTMEEILALYPGAQRTLFQLHHIGGCSSCGFSLSESLAQVCERNEGLDPAIILEEIRSGHVQDEKLLIAPEELHQRQGDLSLRLLDLRTREEFESVSIPGSQLMTQEKLQESMNWHKESELILIDHNGSRVLDAAAYFAGHGFTNVKGLRGGIDAYSEKVDSSLPRYTMEVE